MDPDAELGVESGVLVVRRQGKTLRSLPLHEVEEIHVHGGADLTVSARNLLLSRGIDTLFLTMDGRYRGRLLSGESRMGDRRIRQYRAVTDPARRQPVATAIVAGKVHNQRALLLARQRVHASEAVAGALAAMRSLLGRLESPQPVEVAMGLEGQAAALYFGVFGEVIRNDRFSWTGRNRRPPKDPVNACLSYGYTLLFARAEAAIRQSGLDVYLGMLHESGRNKAALALDLAEEFRPMIDNLVLTLLNRQHLCPEDFGPPDADLLADAPELPTEGAVYLSRVGRSILLRAWTRRLAERSPHPTLEGDWSVAGLIRSQAQALCRSIEDGVPYVPAKLI